MSPKEPETKDAGLLKDADLPKHGGLLSDSGLGDLPDRPAQASPAKPLGKKPGLAPLRGTWSGSAAIPGYGVASGSITVGPKGSFSYRGKVSGIAQRGKGRVLSWDGTTLKVRVQGMNFQIPAMRRGDTLKATVPMVGPVTLYR